MPCTTRLIFLMLGLLPNRTAVIRSFVTATDCAYVRLARSFDFSLSSSSASAGRARRGLQRGQKDEPIARGHRVRDLLCTQAGASAQRQQVTEARVIVEVQ